MGSAAGLMNGYAKNTSNVTQNTGTANLTKRAKAFLKNTKFELFLDVGLLILQSTYPDKIKNKLTAILVSVNKFRKKTA